MKSANTIRFMRPHERKTIESWRKLSHEVDEFVFTWTRWKNWEAAPPIVAAYRGRVVGFHGVTYTKTGYANSAAQYVLSQHRNKLLAILMIDFLLAHSAVMGMKRLRFRTPHTGPGKEVWTGFGVLPFGKCAKDLWFDIDISNIKSAGELLRAGPSLHLPPTTDKRRIGWYRKGEVVALFPEWKEVLT